MNNDGASRRRYTHIEVRQNPGWRVCTLSSDVDHFVSPDFNQSFAKRVRRAAKKAVNIVRERWRRITQHTAGRRGL